MACGKKDLNMKSIYEKLKIGTNTDNQQLLFIKGKNEKLILQTSNPLITVTSITGVTWSDKEPCYRCEFDTLSRFMSSFDSGNVTEYTIKDNTLFVKVGNNVFDTSIATCTLPTPLSTMKNIGTIKTDVLKENLKNISNFAETSDVVDVKATVSIQGIKDRDIIKLTAIDGYMGAVCLIPNAGITDDFTVSVMNNTLKSVVPKLESEVVSFATNGDFLNIIDGNTIYSIRMVAMQPFNLGSALKPTDDAISITMRTEDINNTLKLILNTSKDTHARAEFIVKPNGSGELNGPSTKTKIELTFNKPITNNVIFNLDSKRLKKLLETVSEETVTMIVSEDANTPILIFSPTMKRLIMKIKV